MHIPGMRRLDIGQVLHCAYGVTCCKRTGERGHSVLEAAKKLPEAAAQPTISPTTPWLLAALPGGSGGPAPPSFIADCFFMTQTWLHVGLLPALYRSVCCTCSTIVRACSNQLIHLHGSQFVPAGVQLTHI